MKRFLNILYVFLVATLIFSGCVNQSEKADTISVSILPQKYFIDVLTGNAVDVNVMIPPGAGHATYSPTPMQFKKLSDSRLYIRIGYLGYEQAWIHRLKELNPKMEDLNLSEKTELIRGEEILHGDHVHEGGVDPHIWLSPKVMIDLLPDVKQALINNYPQLKDTIEAHYPQLLAEVEGVHQRLSALSGLLTNRKFMIFHPAMTYLARDYGFEQIAIEQDGKEPSPALLAKTIQYARENDIRVIFIQKEYDVRNAQMVSKETGIKLIQVDYLEYNWTDMMNQIIDKLQENLQ